MSGDRQPAGTVLIGTRGMTADEVLSVARRDARVVITDEAKQALAAGRAAVERLAASPVPVYGVSTGFGALASRHIPAGLRRQLQLSLVRSHAAGMGDLVEREVVRALMLLRLKTLCAGRSGVRPEVAELIAGALNSGITPAVREWGSLGCSGDLAPLSQCALMLVGEGESSGTDGVLRPSSELLAEAGLEPVVLEEKEGLALINGTDGMLGMLLMACADLGDLLDVADLAAAISVEALLGTDRVFRAELHEPLRPHPGQVQSAERIHHALAGSGIVASHLTGHSQVQDAYSLRCAPAVHGAARDTLAHALTVAGRELAAIVDNPVVLDDGTVSSNGNFHGAPVGYVLDFLAIAVADVGSMSERRTDRMLDPARSNGLPPFLAHDAGVDSGLMIAQYTQAGMVSENKRLAVPASADSIPSSAMQEDHVSMGWSAGRKLRTAVDNLRRILAIELTAGARAVALRAPLQPSPLTGPVVRMVNAASGGPGPDRYLAPELAAVEELVRQGRLASLATK